MVFNCMIAGVGGQGTVLASKLIATAAMKRGLDARTTETIGMAQRGGSVVSHVRLGGGFSPLMPLGGADALIAFEPGEAVRHLSYLSEGGRLIVCDTPVKPAASSSAAYDGSEMIDYIKANIPNAIVINGKPINEKYKKMLNVALLGAAAQSGIFPFDADALLKAVSEIKRFREENLEAFKLGREIYLGQH